jgi:hypothetical protein
MSSKRIEIRDGREYVVTELAEVKPRRRGKSTGRLRCGKCGKPLRGKGCASKRLPSGEWWARCADCVREWREGKAG